MEFLIAVASINTMVICRLEKHGVEREHLVMMNYSSMEKRQQAKKHTEFKADVYLKPLCR